MKWFLRNVKNICGCSVNVVINLILFGVYIICYIERMWYLIKFWFDYVCGVIFIVMCLFWCNIMIWMIEFLLFVNVCVAFRNIFVGGDAFGFLNFYVMFFMVYMWLFMCSLLIFLGYLFMILLIIMNVFLMSFFVGVAFFVGVGVGVGVSMFFIIFLFFCIFWIMWDFNLVMICL